jgi:3-hydroxyisobutyrate dehydrogenase
MGLPMAINLATKSDYSLLAFDLNDQALKLAEQVEGIQVATSLEAIMDLTQGTTPPSTVVSMLPGDAAVDSVMRVISSSISRKMTIIDCSTVSPTTSRKWYNTFTEKDCLFVDAPVSGGVKGAKDATLTFMVGSDEETLFDCPTVHSILSHMGSRIIPCGGPGAGAAVKLCNNLALAAQMVGICEAMNLGEALGVDPTVVAAVMNTSTAKSWSCEVNNPHPQVAAMTGSPASNDYQGGFGTRLMLKDLGLAVSAGKEANVALPIGHVVSELYRMADLRGLGDKDFGVILQFLRGR